MVCLKVFRQIRWRFPVFRIIEHHHAIGHQAPLHNVRRLRRVGRNHQITDILPQKVCPRNARWNHLKADARSFLPQRSHQARQKQVPLVVIGSNREGELCRGGTERRARGQRLQVIQNLADMGPGLKCVAGWHNAAPGLHEQGVAQGLAQTFQRVTHRRLGNAQPDCRAGHAAFIKHRQKGAEGPEIQVECINRVHEWQCNPMPAVALRRLA